jgi:hypothetical protein
MSTSSKACILSLIILSSVLGLSACNAPTEGEPVRGQIEVIPAQPTAMPDTPEVRVVLDLCSLLTEDEVAEEIGVPVTASADMGIANCTYTSTDTGSPYSVSVSSAQGIEAKELNLVGVQLLLAFASDQAALNSINQLVEQAETLSVWEVVDGVIQFQEDLGMEVKALESLGERARWIWNAMGGYGTLMWVQGETYLSLSIMGIDPGDAEVFALALAQLAAPRLPKAFTVSTTGEFGGGFTFEYSSEPEPAQTTKLEGEMTRTGPPAVWVTTSYGGTIAYIDPQSNSLASSISVGKGLHDIVAGLDYIFVSNGDTSSLLWVDPVFQSVINEIPIESGSHLKLSLDDEYLYIGAPRWGAVEVRRRNTGELIERMTYANCWDVEVSQHGLWLINGPEQEYIVDLNLGSWDEDLVFEPGGSISYIKYYRGYYWLGVKQDVHKILKVDPVSHEIVAELAIDAGEQYMSAMGVGESGVWVGFSEGMLVKIDPESMMERLRVWGMENPVWIIGGYGGVWVSYIAEDAVARLDPETLDPVAIISVDQAPYAIALNP